MELSDAQKFERAKADAKAFYSSISKVYCPYFKEKIAFNTKGLEHLRFKRRGAARSASDQYVRYRLLPVAPKILALSTTVQGISHRKDFEYEKTHSRWDIIMRNTTYYEFIAVIKDYRMRVIVKQIENGPKYFWSIIPFWRLSSETGSKLVHSGKPYED
jgi:hypothetical protein